MDFDDYQFKALGSDQTPEGENSVVIPLLGLAGEVGTLVSEYKKRLRDGASHAEYKDLVAEELGDLLWYLANLASKHGLSLSGIAESNLLKVNDRWNPDRRSFPAFFDVENVVTEQLPRRFSVVFNELVDNGRRQVEVTWNGRPFGDPLTDAAVVEDGYRFHDALHIALATYLAWSPVTRRNTGTKRKSDSTADESQDGGRAIVIEEAACAHAFAYAQRHNLLKNIEAVDFETLRTIQDLVEPFEVSVRSSIEWQIAIVEGIRLFDLLLQHGGGTLHCDLVERTIEYVSP
jgi:NTP pyrophosphatase (non-canonical NTP hydrolase)